MLQSTSINEFLKKGPRNLGPANSEFSPLSQLSHELRTPLAGILGMAEVLSNDGLTQSQLELVEFIRQSGDRLLQAVNGLLGGISTSEVKDGPKT